MRKADVIRFLLLALAVAGFFPGWAGFAHAGDQADRAVKAVLALKAEGKIPTDATVRILAKEGNVSNVWGRNFEIKGLWEKETGIKIDTATRQNLPIFEDMKKNSDFDLTLSRQREYPDLFVNGLIVDLTPFVKKYGLDFSKGEQGGYLAPTVQTQFDGKVVAIPADGDLAILYLRRDLMEDPAKKAAFKAKYGRELLPPVTWDEYLELLEFFNDPKAGFYGSCEQRNPANGWMFWMPRYASQAYPQQYLFDDDMHPLVNSPAGIAATDNYVKTVPLSPPEILAETSDYPYTVTNYRKGNALAIIQTLALAKIANADSSPVKGKVMAVEMPGTYVKGKLVRRTSFIYGNNLVVSKSSKNPELAFLFAMWFTDPDISSKSIQMTSGLMDPYRESHLQDEKVWQIYTKDAVDQLLANVAVAVPEGTGLPGDSEYMKALSVNLWRAAKGELSSAQAMERTASEWEEITRRYGRERQIAHWRAFKQLYPK